MEKERQRELLNIMLATLRQSNYRSTLITLGSESTSYFDKEYFKELLSKKRWDKIETYVFGFLDGGECSKKMILQLKKLKYLEFINEGNEVEAAKLLTDEFKETFIELAGRLWNTIGEDEIQSMSTDVHRELDKLIEKNPAFAGKLQLPDVRGSPLLDLIQSYINHRPNEDIVPPHIGQLHDLSAIRAASSPSTGISELSPPERPSKIQRHVDYLNKVTDSGFPGRPWGFMDEGSAVNSMDFHPMNEHLLIVGTDIGQISLWNVAVQKRIARTNFKINLLTCSNVLKASLESDHVASVNRVMWSPDGTLIGVAYSKNILQLYHSPTNSRATNLSDLESYHQIEAHHGAVNNISFFKPDNRLCIITCGDDKFIKVWDTTTGAQVYSYMPHEAPVSSICPQYKAGNAYILSCSTDGKIRVHSYAEKKCFFDYQTIGRGRTSFAYCSDGTRLFSCGTYNGGDSELLEWDDKVGVVKKRYNGLRISPTGVRTVQFSTAQNKYLAVGEQSAIKFWEMNDVNCKQAFPLVPDGFPDCPCLNFSKQGRLLAVATIRNGFSILVNNEGLSFVRSIRDMAIVENANTGNQPNQLIPHDIREYSQLHSLMLPDAPGSVKIMRLLYTRLGEEILALTHDGIHKLWKCGGPVAATAFEPPHDRPPFAIVMTNAAKLEEGVPCLALYKTNSLMSAYGGKVSVYNMETLKADKSFMPPPPAVTCITFLPRDSNIVVLGMEDASIQIYDVSTNEVINKLQGGHRTRVTGLVFSEKLGLLFSAGADAQLCVWSGDRWNKKISKHLSIPFDGRARNLEETRLQLDKNQEHALVLHATQLVTVNSELGHVSEWLSRHSKHAITDATYSCDGKSVYAGIDTGSIAVLTASGLNLRCWIHPTAYLTLTLSSMVYPSAIAAHPLKGEQFAVGLSNGKVHVLEAKEVDWGSSVHHHSTVG